MLSLLSFKVTDYLDWGISHMGNAPRTQTPDAISPALVPTKRLRTGATMPAIGLGTFGSDHVGATEVADAVKGAASIGYRHFDCASVYGNEAQIGHALQQI